MIMEIEMRIGGGLVKRVFVGGLLMGKNAHMETIVAILMMLLCSTLVGPWTRVEQEKVQ